MVLDGHIHTESMEVDKVLFEEAIKAMGIGGGILISPRPDLAACDGSCYTAGERMDKVLSLTGNNKYLYPFYWIDPMEREAGNQAAAAAAAGAAGFKVMCSRFYPGDPAAMKVYQIIADLGKPILFHSGILYDGLPSSRYNRPGEFEALLEVKGLKFCLAHISWPWVDECIAVFGKFRDASRRRDSLQTEMFIDITPGTPPTYREEALKKLFSVGFETENSIIFGSDWCAGDYYSKEPEEFIRRDNEIYERLGLDENMVKRIYSDNLLRFVGAL